MKMVKSLLLGSAAGVVAVAGAQAADLPVKAKPVEYVKVCSLYGAGYYYIPGTDICMKVGGYVRAEYSYGYGNNMTNTQWSTPSAYQSRIEGADYNQRTRAYITTETRQQTAYGTLRTYLNVGTNADFPGSSNFNANRAFIQIAGFTIGTATSFFDFYSAPAVAYIVEQSSDSGDGGMKVFAYTAQFGNGVSASLSAEEPRRSSVVNTLVGATGLVGTTTAFATNNASTSVVSTNPFVVGSLPTADQIKIRYPDLVANLRVDQAWGSAQVMGALHDASGGYYGTSLGNWNTGHPSDKMGWAVGVGVKINTPFISPGDYFMAQYSYANGATRYVSFTPAGAYSPTLFNGNSFGTGFYSDGVYAGSSATATSSTGVELTTAWGIAAAYEHFWTPSLRTSVHGSYHRIQHNANATSLIRAASCNSNYTATAISAGQTALASGTLNGQADCNPDWSFWQIGSRTQWNVTKDFYMGFDVVYTRLNTAFAGTALYRANTGSGVPSGTYTVENQQSWATRVRFHRDIVP